MIEETQSQRYIEHLAYDQGVSADDELIKVPLAWATAAARSRDAMLMVEETLALATRHGRPVRAVIRDEAGEIQRRY
jgi:hypothetical protein